MSEEVKKFLEEYEKLCKKYEMGLVGCGCCGSPILVDKEGIKIILDNVNYEDNCINVDNRHWKDYKRGVK